jgi:4'-phosphopantetheinyl transferase
VSGAAATPPEGRPADAAPAAALYLLDYEDLGEAERRAWLAAAPSLLDPEERARFERFIPLEKRLEFALSRALLRAVLEGAHGVAGARLPEAADGAKPRLLAAALDPIGTQAKASQILPAANLSHSRGAIALAVAPPGEEVGIDVERIRDEVSDALVEGTMRAEERAALGGAEGFFLRWAAKEAYMKLLGTGLAVGPRRLRVDLAARTVADVRTGDVRPVRAERWRDWALAWMAGEAREVEAARIRALAVAPE